MNDEIMSRRRFLKIGGNAVLAAAALSAIPSFAKNAFAQETASLEHLIEKTFPKFIISGYDLALKPTDENLQKYNSLKTVLKEEESDVISKGMLRMRLDAANYFISEELEKKGYVYQRLDIEQRSDVKSYILGKILGAETENDFKIFSYKPLVPTLGGHQGFKSLAYRTGKNVYIDSNQAIATAEDILQYSGNNLVTRKFCKRISDEADGSRQKIFDDIIYSIKIHETKGHRGLNTVEGEERAMLVEIADSRNMYPIYRIWSMVQDQEVSWSARKASAEVIEKIVRYGNGKNAIGEFPLNSNLAFIGEKLANAKLDSIKRVAGEVLKNYSI